MLGLSPPYAGVCLQVMMVKLSLIQRDDCELCNQAWALLSAAGVRDFDSRWIDGDADMEPRYGQRVPVLRDEANDRELDWPFDAQALRCFVAAA